MSATLKSTLLALDALARGPRRNLDAADAPRVRFQLQVRSERGYRGAQWHQAGNGDEWLRQRELIRAGQRDLFGE